MLQIALSIESRDFLTILFLLFNLFIFSYIFSFSLSAKTGCQCFWNGRGWLARFPIGMPNYLKPFTQYKSNMVNNFLQFLLYKIIKTCAFLLVIRSQINKFPGTSINNIFLLIRDMAPTYLLLPLGKRGSKWGDFYWAIGCV